jgi:hypothetical protein
MIVRFSSRWPRVTALIVAVVSSGCATASESKMAATTLGVSGSIPILIGGPMILAHAIGCSDTEPNCNDASPTTGELLLAAGAAMLITSIVVGLYSTQQQDAEDQAHHERARIAGDWDQVQGDLRAEQEMLRREPIEREHAEKERIRKQSVADAFALLKTAAQAARTGDCATAIGLGEQIRGKNVEVWQGWFLRDLEIRRCLDAAAAALTPPVPPDAGPSTAPQPQTP